MIQQFLSEGPYVPNDGFAVSLKDFTFKYVRWLADPQLQQWWSNKNRIEWALRHAGYPVAFMQLRGEYIGNLSGPCPIWPYKDCNRKLIDEDGWLWPQDRTDAPSGTPTSSYRVSKPLRPVYANAENQHSDS